MLENKVVTLEDMKDMSIEEIVTLYKYGYRLGESSLKTLQYDCSAPMFGAALVGIGIGGIIVALIIKSAVKS